MWTALESHEPPGRTSRPDGNRMTLENYPLQVYPLVPGLLRVDGVYHTWDMISTTANCETKSLLQLALSISSEPLLAQLQSQREIYYASFAVDTIFPPVFGKIQSRRRADFFANVMILRKRNNFRCCSLCSKSEIVLEI